ERVLEGARERAVVLGRREEHCVGLRDLSLKVRNRGRDGEVLVEGGDRGEALPGHDFDADWGGGRCCGGQRAVVGAAAAAAADREQTHHGVLISSSWTVISTSQPTASPPPGSSACQSRPQLRRSIVVTSSRPARWLPNGSSVGGRYVPVAITDRGRSRIVS